MGLEILERAGHTILVGAVVDGLAVAPRPTGDSVGDVHRARVRLIRHRRDRGVRGEGNTERWIEALHARPGRL